jgi:hypothetical protein
MIAEREEMAFSAQAEGSAGGCKIAGGIAGHRKVGRLVIKS